MLMDRVLRRGELLGFFSPAVGAIQYKRILSSPILRIASRKQTKTGCFCDYSLYLHGAGCDDGY